MLGGVYAMPLSMIDRRAEFEDLRQQRDRISALLIDYDAEDAFGFTRLVARSKQIDFSVSLCGSIIAAGQLLRKAVFDVIYVDYWLGFETSIPFIADVARKNHAPIVLMSALDSPDIRRCAYRAGASGFLAKDELSIQAVESVTLAVLRRDFHAQGFHRPTRPSPKAALGGLTGRCYRADQVAPSGAGTVKSPCEVSA
jgi:DNA-binding NarL/FixJ family response regulator